MIRLATKNDINAIKIIEDDCFLECWTENMLIDSMDNGCIMVVVELNEQIVGYAGVYPNGDITNVAVLKEYRGNGYGKLLVKELIKQASLNKIDKLFLEVRVSNLVAIKLYENCGFKCISQRKRYYKDGEDALIYAFGGV